MDIKLFKSVFNNIVISRIIYFYSKLYKKNEVVYFYFKSEIRNYKEKQFITKLIYDGSKLFEVEDTYNQIEYLDKDDFYIGGVLKEIKFQFIDRLQIARNVIPYGVEIIDYCNQYCSRLYQLSTPFSNLPITVSTIKNAIINNDHNNNYNEGLKIPLNITSITFHIFSAPITVGNKGYVSIPNTIRHLKFPNYFKNDNIKLQKGDIPNGIINLSIKGLHINNNIDKNILPNSLESLKIAINNIKYGSDNGCDGHGNIFEYLPENIKKLSIIYRPKEIQFNKLKEVKSIDEVDQQQCKNDNVGLVIPKEIIKIPCNITHLKIHEYNKDYSRTYVDTEPQLSLDKLLSQIDLLNSSLIHLEFKNILPKSDQDITKLISLLPNSLSSITLPLSYENYNIKFPTEIKQINFK